MGKKLIVILSLKNCLSGHMRGYFDWKFTNPRIWFLRGPTWYAFGDKTIQKGEEFVLSVLLELNDLEGSKSLDFRSIEKDNLKAMIRENNPLNSTTTYLYGTIKPIHSKISSLNTISLQQINTNVLKAF